MGKKRVSMLGSEDEKVLREKKAEKLKQKKLREGVVAKTDDTVVASAPVVTQEEKAKSAKRVHTRSKSYLNAKKVVEGNSYSISDALKTLRQVSLAKFDSTVEMHINVREKGFSKEVELPHSTGKTKRIAIADEKTIASIEKGVIDFDVLIASAEQMAKLVKFAKVLGPKGLMPNPKNGTVVPNPEKTAKEMSSRNSLKLKTEKDVAVIHVIVGKLSLEDKKLEQNIKAVLDVLSGQILKAILKSTMSPAIKLQV